MTDHDYHDINTAHQYGPSSNTAQHPNNILTNRGLGLCYCRAMTTNQEETAMQDETYIALRQLQDEMRAHATYDQVMQRWVGQLDAILSDLDCDEDDSACPDDLTTYGLSIDTSEYKPERDLISAVETSLTGNVILRVGREHVGGGGWHQVAHVVLTPDETMGLAKHLERFC